jgi:hypothetical protein
MNGRQDSGSAKCYVRINDKIVSGQNTAASGQFANQNGVYQVNVGDKIQLSTDATSDLVFKCFFIPPKLVAKDVIDPTQPEYESVQVVPDYAKVETGANLMSNYANMGSHEDSNGDVYTLYSAEWTAARTGFARITYDYEQNSPGDMMSYEIAVDGVLVKSISLSMDGGTKFSQTETIPVSAGQTVAFKSRCMNELSNTVNCEFVPPLASVTKTPIVSENYENVTMVPDYNNEGTTNLLSAGSWSYNASGNFYTYKSSIWTADRVGWVRCFINFNFNTGTTWAENIILVNGKEVSRSGSTPAAYIYGDTVMVQAGDTVQIIRQANTNVDTLSVVFARFIPPKYITTKPLVVSEDYMNVAMIPDYANEEQLGFSELFTSGEWSTGSGNYYYETNKYTVDRVGYIRCLMDFDLYSGPNTWYTDFFYINNKEVMVVSGGNTEGNRSIFNGIFPVKPGDVVHFCRESSHQDDVNEVLCRFVPPKFINQRAPVITVSGASYSNAEQLTGETWVDGKPIYRRAFSGNNTSKANATNTITLLPKNSVSQIVDSGGNVGSPTSAGLWFPVNSYNATYGSAQIQSYNTGELMLLITNPGSNATTKSYNVWVEYTKTTD